MAATPKRKMSSARKGRRLAHQYKAKLPQLVRTAAGKLVPAHTVTADNPVYKGTKFVTARKQSK